MCTAIAVFFHQPPRRAAKLCLNRNRTIGAALLSDVFYTASKRSDWQLKMVRFSLRTRSQVYIDIAIYNT